MTLARRVIALAVFLAAWSAAIERLPPQSYRERRQELASRHSDGVIVMFGYAEDEGQDARLPFRQENNFYYLSGWDEPGAVLYLQGESQSSPYREILFLPAHNRSEEAWTGRRLGPDDPGANEKTGFAEVHDVKDLRKVVSAALESRPRLYTLLPRYPPGLGQQPDPDRSAQLEELGPRFPKIDIRESLDSLRLIKSEGEMQLIRQAVGASVAAHLAAWARISPGLYEYQLAATMLAVMMDRGCLRPAYTPIIGSGMNSTVLHYDEGTGRLEPGDLVVMDVGGEYGHYAADITRTVPVDGRFTKRQREIYEIVLGAQEAAILAVRPGRTLAGHGPGSLTEIVREYFNSHGSSHGEPLDRFFTHGLGHHVGLEVHDPGDAELPLKPGMVITIEPGLYLPEEGFGVRIEDMLLVTGEGAEVLSKDLPKDPNEIERRVNAGASASR